MNRRRLILFTTLALLAVLAGTIWLAVRHGGSEALGPGGNDRFVTDMAGRQVRVPPSPRRMLSLCTTATDTAIALGATDRLAGIDEYSRVIPGSERVAVVGKGSALSREAVVALHIDLAFIWWYQDDAAAMLEDLAIPAVRIRSGRAAELPATIRLIGQCVNAPDAAATLATKVETFLSRSPATPTANAPQVFLELNGPFKTMGGDTYTNDLLELAGLRNIAADAKGSVLLSAERLTQTDPDAILVVGAANDITALVQRPGFAELRAVRKKQVFALDRYWLVAGPNLPQSVAHIRAAIAAPAVSSASKE
jgi:iron complex transport system substrate-binding protein